MLPTIAPSTSTFAQATRCTSARIGSEPQLALEPGHHLEVGLTIVGLVQDVEVTLREADAAEAIRAAAASDALDQVGAAHASLALGAVLAGQASGASQAVRAIRAVCTRYAVLRSGDPFAIDAEGGVGASLASLAADASRVRRGAGVLGDQALVAR